jgi:hypothetical protein
VRHVLLIAVGAGLLVGCGCGGGPARVKGRVVENGQPVVLEPGEQASVVFYPDAGGKPGDRAYAAGVNPDGTFELVASGGELPPGSYLVSLEVNPGNQEAKKPKSVTGIARFKDRYKLVKWELKPGTNDLTIDLAKPTG